MSTGFAIDDELAPQSAQAEPVVIGDGDLAKCRDQIAKLNCGEFGGNLLSLMQQVQMRTETFVLVDVSENLVIAGSDDPGVLNGELPGWLEGHPFAQPVMIGPRG